MFADILIFSAVFAGAVVIATSPFRTFEALTTEFSSILTFSSIHFSSHDMGIYPTD